MKLWYKSPAQAWIEALPLGNGALAHDVGVPHASASPSTRIRSDGHPRETDVPGAAEKLSRAQELIDQGRYLKRRIM